MKRAFELVQYLSESAKKVELDLSAKLPKIKEAVTNVMTEFVDEDALLDVLL